MQQKQNAFLASTVCYLLLPACCEPGREGRTTQPFVGFCRGVELPSCRVPCRGFALPEPSALPAWLAFLLSSCGLPQTLGVEMMLWGAGLTQST